MTGLSGSCWSRRVRCFSDPTATAECWRPWSKSGCLADAQRRGIKHLFYGQIDNPLLQVCDELFLGSHMLAGSEMTTQVVRKREPLERVGNVVSIDGKVQVIEYSDLPEEFARQTNADGRLKLWAGNLAVHAFDVEFLARAAQQSGALPFHMREEESGLPGCSRANWSSRSEPNAIRFERFIFDLLPLAEKALVVEVDPAEAFAPVKNSDDEADRQSADGESGDDGPAPPLAAGGGSRRSPTTCRSRSIRCGPARSRRSSSELHAGHGRLREPTYFSPDGPRVIGSR